MDPHTPFISRSALRAEETAATMDFEVVLSMRNFAELQARVSKSEQIPLSEMAAKYQPAAADYQTVVDWLTGQGFQIIHRDASHLAVFARGTVGHLQQALNLRFAKVQFEAKEYTSAVSAPQVPSALAPLLLGINGLQPHLHPHKHLIAKADLTSNYPPYLPSQIAQAYDATGLYNSNVTGAGQTIAIVIDTFPATSDLVSFWQTYGVNQSINNISFIQVIAGTLPAPSGEETLDTEWSSSIAPGAKVRIYATTELTDTYLDDAYRQVYADVTTNPGLGIHQMSMSYGIGETYTSLSQVQTDDQYFAELASAGVTVFASSGDDGSTPDGKGGERGRLQVESPASDPNVTGVGGTSLVLGTSDETSSETVWNNSYGASGGGASEYFSRPSWQTGTGVASGTTRLVPDLACTADPNYGAAVILNGALAQYGGTSWSSPTVAGFCALLNQVRASAGMTPLAILGPYLYPLIGTANLGDIINGSNATSKSSGRFAATVGYDEASGVGVPLVQALAQTLTPAATVTSASSQPSGTPATLALPLSLTGTPTIEPRVGPSPGSYTVVVNFSAAVSSSSQTPMTATLGLQAGQAGSAAGSAQIAAVNGSAVIVSLTNVGDAQRLNLRLAGVQPGNVTVNIPVNILWGDANGDGSVTSADITPVKNAYGATVGSANYNLRADLNADGAVSSADINPVKSFYGTSLP